MERRFPIQPHALIDGQPHTWVAGPVKQFLQHASTFMRFRRWTRSCLDRGTAFREHLRHTIGHQHIILDANAEVRISRGDLHIWTPCTEIEARFHRQYHPGLKQARRTLRPIDAHIVDVQSKPVTGVVHVPASKIACVTVESSGNILFDDPEVDQTLSQGTSC